MGYPFVVTLFRGDLSGPTSPWKCREARGHARFLIAEWENAKANVTLVKHADEVWHFTAAF
eukprot:5033410-Pyramimonas_sp.AAC.1